MSQDQNQGNEVEKVQSESPEGKQSPLIEISDQQINESPQNPLQIALQAWKAKLPDLVQQLQAIIDTPLPQVKIQSLRHYPIMPLNNIIRILIENQQNDQMTLSFEIKDKLQQYIQTCEKILGQQQEKEDKAENPPSQMDEENQENNNLSYNIENLEDYKIKIQELKSEVENTDVYKQISEIGVMKNYGLAKSFKGKGLDLKRDTVNRNAWEIQDLKDVENVKEIQEIYNERKHQKDKIGKICYLIQKIELAKNDSKLSKYLEEIATAFNKIEENNTEKKSKKREKTVRQAETNQQTLEQNLEKKLLLTSPNKQVQEIKSAKKKTTAKKKVKIDEEQNQVRILEESKSQMNGEQNGESQKTEDNSQKSDSREKQEKPKKKTSLSKQSPKKDPKKPQVVHQDKGLINNKKMTDFFTLSKPQKKKTHDEEKMEVEDKNAEEKQLFKKCSDKISFLTAQSFKNEQTDKEFNDFYNSLTRNHHQESYEKINDYLKQFKNEARQELQEIGRQGYINQDRKIYIILKDSKISYKGVVFNKQSSFIHAKNFLKKDPSMIYDMSSDEELEQQGTSIEGSDDEKESNDGSQNASGFLIVSDGEDDQEDFDSQSDVFQTNKPQFNRNVLQNLMEKKKKLEPYLLQQAHGGECLRHFQDNFKVQTIGQVQFPIPTKKEDKVQTDFFEENNQELLKAFIEKIHGSYEYKKDIINNFMNDYADKKLSRRKLEIKFDLIATKQNDDQLNMDNDKEKDKKLTTQDKRYYVSQTVLNAVEMEPDHIQNLLDTKKDEKMKEREEKKKQREAAREERKSIKKQERKLLRQKEKDQNEKSEQKIENKNEEQKKNNSKQQTLSQYITKKNDFSDNLIVNISQHSSSPSKHELQMEEKSTSDQVENDQSPDQQQEDVQQQNSKHEPMQIEQ